MKYSLYKESQDSVFNFQVGLVNGDGDVLVSEWDFCYNTQYSESWIERSEARLLWDKLVVKGYKG